MTVECSVLNGAFTSHLSPRGSGISLEEEVEKVEEPEVENFKEAVFSGHNRAAALRNSQRF